MHVQHLVGKRSQDAPSGSLLESHKLLSRGGYVRQVGQGIFTLLPLGARVARALEAILREEMNAIGGQEILMPVAVPDSLWQKSGRLEGVGSELVRFNDRTGQGHVLNMTHEEVVVDACAACVDSYKQLPCMVWQIQTKFRDEPRSRGGLVRVREFTMKDAYSLHRTQEDLEQYYEICHEAYERIFRRFGMSKVLSIKSDVGMMGGSLAHEFMFLSEHGEDHLILCPSGDYKANREIASFDLNKVVRTGDAVEMKTVDTPGTKTIEEVASFLKVDAEDCCRANALVADEERMVMTFVRGDLNLSMAKLRNAVGAGQLRPMQEDEIQKLGIVEGFMGPNGLHKDVDVYVDPTVMRAASVVVGANETDKHITGFNFQRDAQGLKEADIAECRAGLPCPCCGTALESVNGIEIGNIFQLGTKYSEAMGFTYTEENGKGAHPIMGCYGIGVGRSLACLVEEHHDDNGPIWPMDVAPFEAQVCCIQAKKQPVRDAGNAMYDELRELGVETLLDDRPIGAGFMFADADLMGAPVRAVISPRNMDGGVVEMKYRAICAGGPDADQLPESIPMEGAAQRIKELVELVRELDRVEIGRRCEAGSVTA